MINIIAAILAIGVCYLSVRLLLLKKSMKDVGNQLQEINRDLEENRIVKISAPDRELEELLMNVNDSLYAIRQEKIAYAKREKAFKQQIENISHDLRTPLTSMLGYLRIMDMNSLSVEVQEDLNTVIRKTERLQELITQFYDFSRLTDSEYSVALEAVEVTKTLREALADSYVELSARQLEVVADIPENAVVVMANENALQRVIQNLLQNAARYAKSSLEVSVKETEEDVVICFVNDVENIDECDVEHLFERFYTSDRARTNGSTGLGLTIAKEFVEKMDGSMEARREGSRLCIRIRFAGKKGGAIKLTLNYPH